MAPEEQRRYPAGHHPNSRRNLTPFRPGDSPNTNGVKGPRITPAMRKFVDMPLRQVQEIAKKPEKLSVAEAIAITTLLDALTTGAYSTGAKSRDQVLQRLDGDDAAGIGVAIAVKLTWFDGEQA
jgi:hypothetical protein